MPSTRSMSAKVPFPLLLASLAVSFSRPSRDWSTRLLIHSTPTLSCTSSSTLLRQSMYVIAPSFMLFLKRGRVAPLALRLFFLLVPISALLLFLSLVVAVGDHHKVGRFSVICHDVVQILLTIVGFIWRFICGYPIVHGGLIGFLPTLGIRGHRRGPGG